MKFRHVCTVFILHLFLLSAFSSACFAEKKRPVRPSQKDKCPVCGMFVAKYPDFLAEVLFRDGSYAIFDGTKDMFKYYLGLERYAPAKKRSDVEAVYVTDYYGLSLIDGLNAYYVSGSDVFGPMGKEFIAFGKEADALEFKRDHRGKAVLRFGDITIEILREAD